MHGRKTNDLMSSRLMVENFVKAKKKNRNILANTICIIALHKFINKVYSSSYNDNKL